MGKLNGQLSLGFSGQCEAALTLYEKWFNATSYVLRWGDSPAKSEAPSDWHAKIYHATVKIGDFTMACSDPLPDAYEAPKGFQILLQMDDTAEAERVFAAMAEHCRVGMPLQETFWAKRFGVVTDPFGLTWSINCE